MHWQEELILGGRVESGEDALLRCVLIGRWWVGPADPWAATTRTCITPDAGNTDHFKTSILGRWEVLEVLTSPLVFNLKLLFLQRGGAPDYVPVDESQAAVRAL